MDVSKRSLISRESQAERDRISSLPDCILHEILSFLDTNFAARTSILSKRWKDVWVSMPYINLQFDKLNLNVDHVVESKKIVEKVLNRRDEIEIKRFVFCSYFELEPSFAQSMLSRVIVHHKAREIEIITTSTNNNDEDTIDNGDIIELPKCLFLSDSLEKFTLRNCYVDLSKTAGFRGVKELSLHGLKERTPHAVAMPLAICPEFFCKCPALEVLSIVDCFIGGEPLGLGALVISAPRLKKLEIVFPWAKFYESVMHVRVVSAPLLTHFKFQGSIPVKFSMDDDCNCSALEEVEIDLPHTSYFPREEIIQRLINMIKALQHTKFLVLSLNILELLSSVLEKEASLFTNLKKLKLKTDWSVPKPALDFLLKRSGFDLETSINGSFRRIL